jgi:hypothetical protein
LLQSTSSNWASTGSYISEECGTIVDSGGGRSGIVSKLLVGQTCLSQDGTIWLLGHRPAIEINDRTVRVLAGNTDGICVTGIDVFLGGNFTGGGINDKIGSSVSTSTSSDLKGARINGSAQSGMRIGEENDGSCGSNVESSRIYIIDLNICMGGCLEGSGKSSGTVSGLFNDPTIFLDDTSGKILTLNTKSLFISSINVLSDGKGEVW